MGINWQALRKSIYEYKLWCARKEKERKVCEENLYLRILDKRELRWYERLWLTIKKKVK